jgi:tRNA G18 (ribose-2'-O)-methylase SpoU
MTQLYLHPFRPEQGDARPLRKLARNFRAEYRQYQNALELQRDTAIGRWVAIESAQPGAKPFHEVDWIGLTSEFYARQEGLHLVVGSMNHGLPPEVLLMMDHHVYIPQFDDVPFLAPASAAAIVLQDVFQKVANREGVFG